MKRNTLVYSLMILFTVLAGYHEAECGTKDKFGFGIEYFMLTEDDHEIAGQYSEIGAKYSKTNGAFTFWEVIEPKPPVKGVHTYNWEGFDKAARAMQDAGFTNLTVVLGPKSGWGSEAYTKKSQSKTACTPPKDDKECANDNPGMGMSCWQAYEDYVRAFVARYSRDYSKLGLKAPILRYEIMTEAQHDVQWQVSESRDRAEEYIKVLRASYKAAKSVNPDVKIILSGMMSFDLFDDGALNDNQITQKFNERKLQPPKGKGFKKGDCRNAVVNNLKEQLDFNSRILKETDYYDEVEFHLLSYYTAIEGTTDWIRRQMPRDSRKPIWVGDAGIAPPIPSHDKTGPFACFSTVNVFSSPHYEDGDNIYEVLTSRKDKSGYSYSKQVLPWFYREQSNFLAKSLIIEMSLGIAGTHIYTWLDGEPSFIMISWVKHWMIHGLRDGNFRPKITVGDPRPVFYTYKMIIDKLGDFTSAERLESANSKLQSYKFIVGGKPVYVFWYDDRMHQKPGETESSITIDVSSIIGKTEAKVTHIITEHGQKEPRSEMVGTRKMVIPESPVFVE